MNILSANDGGISSRIVLRAGKGANTNDVTQWRMVRTFVTQFTE